MTSLTACARTTTRIDNELATPVIERPVRPTGDYTQKDVALYIAKLEAYAAGLETALHATQGQ